MEDSDLPLFKSVICSGQFTWPPSMQTNLTITIHLQLVFSIIIFY